MIDNSSQLKNSIFYEFANVDLNGVNDSEKQNKSNNDNSNNENNGPKYKYDVKTVSNNLGGPALSLFSTASMSALSLNKNSTTGIIGKINAKNEEKKKKI